MKKVSLLLAILLTVSIFITACGSGKELEKEINIGYFPNISHAPAMVGIEKGYIKNELDGYEINTMNFPNGSLFMDSLTTGQIDIGYVGPGPVLNRYLQGGEVVVIGNASVGENVLVVRKDSGIKSIKDLDGKIVATPSTGCTHDLLFRKVLMENGMATEENGGTVKRIAQKPATMIGLFEQGQIDAAAVSEPWASLMEAQGVVEIIRDADEMPWGGNLSSTVLVARKDFLESNEELVNDFLKAHNTSIDFINDNSDETIKIVSKSIKEITNQEIEKDVIESSLNRTVFTSSVDANILQEFANLSKDLGFIEGSSDLTKLFWDKLN